MNWKNSEGEIAITVPIRMCPGPKGLGEYEIHIVKRPHYCDRGDWIIQVWGRNDLDEADGFPRYFFGTEQEVITQMETWLNKRQAYTNYEKEQNKHTANKHK